ncbi:MULTISPECIES: lysoplasmalogenase [unclassified Kaistella]|uniref:lysoplasmalogenase n=1 Tax=unclassified Kaistella TaxID=2762626 RepID=UPI0027358E2C|nr:MULTISPECIES: lysoplasmalogenase [unclassified Kaistella]MDP2452700.1 lysoplasmalogenase [Kaistella sp. SH11-4b]MDP2455609.1 lysoplasmalogenase [Kaistella sp. SH40-3]MDP2458513.1 lysoplasmalogenase [Kaistella sp. SH19-2b]
MKSKISQIILIIVFAIDLFLIFTNKIDLRFFTKPLLIPILILMYFSRVKSEKTQLNLFFISGLVLSFFGDLFLLFKWGFLPGLGSFLVAHLFYIISFKKKLQKPISEIWPIILSIYASILFVFLFPYLKEMKIPVTIYAIVIATMMYNAIKTHNRNLIIGALLFLISDTLLSINLFLKPLLILNLMVMITYIAAQWFLVKGMISDEKN